MKRGKFWPKFYHCNGRFENANSVIMGERCRCAIDSHSKLWQLNTYSHITVMPTCGSWITCSSEAKLEPYCHITSCDLSSSVFKVIMVPNTQPWENTSQEGMLRPILTDHLKKQQVSKDILRKDPRMTFRDLWGSRPTTSYLEAAPRACHPLDSSGYVSCDSLA